VAWLGVLDSTHNNNRRRAERAACSQQQQREKCLREVPGVTGAVFEFYCDTNERIRKKKTTAAAAVAVRPTIRRIRTVPDGTEGEKNANCVTKNTTTQHG
jgi:hypothetical protein